MDHIPIAKDTERNESGSSDTSHVHSWDENCGWTKLRLFELDSYDTILYIDADCLVVKDVGHLLRIDEGLEKRVGLLAAVPDIFPPDKFNAGVMVLRPSKAVFDEMMSRLPPDSETSNACTSYDGGDTGFLNSFYRNWYSFMPSYSRLPFGYNAQRFMHHCTYEKQPKYWDDAIEDIRIIHFSSSPKPWDKEDASKSINESKDQQQSYLDGNDTKSIQVAKRGKLESLWQTAYKRSQKYYVKELEKESKKSSNHQKTSSGAKAPPRSAAPSAKPQNTHRMVQKRFKELRKSGMDTKEAMKTARSEHGLDREEEGRDPARAVGQMFGLM